MMESEGEGASRREMLGVAGALAAMMLQPGWASSALAQAPALKSDPRFAFIDAVAELTIPTTDTPGASAAGVPAFVLMALDRHISGLDPALLTVLKTKLDADAGGNFLGRSPADQLKLLTALDDAAYGPNAEGQPGPLDEQQRQIAAREASTSAANPTVAAAARAPTPIAAWRKIKAAIIAGYYTSEIGGSQELVYDPVPGRNENITIGADYRATSNEGFGGRI